MHMMDIETGADWLAISQFYMLSSRLETVREQGRWAESEKADWRSENGCECMMYANEDGWDKWVE